MYTLRGSGVRLGWIVIVAYLLWRHAQVREYYVWQHAPQELLAECLCVASYHVNRLMTADGEWKRHG